MKWEKIDVEWKEKKSTDYLKTKLEMELMQNETLTRQYMRQKNRKTDRYTDRKTEKKTKEKKRGKKRKNRNLNGSNEDRKGERK